ncbi:MAG TPA: type I glyceraldehyde-3-phosphate dehydrogenase [Syntrophorhabdaceae bacterium]|nr:type I glyceraldehyde-3-phosphate dehydrogenase [Syntrophorhabdaceae bacterium]HOL04969.1 type I glyceraldehyde-3-phosphate dehydrogenase [Syntrophorhabdaceae bacterium]HON85199.1 type I glyceraldehyde-3-phosphate dehydrogenase [Syntrophorhabdaceae bacterium]HOT41996.1 type I glyceraldehyde-3-phosphate dehydrogenase [Syntrophorhabdaceae bacterium]HPC66555.1 type I glyceraldehyde-3-phosphate dehydrogenase [Syntrophorhabdaceae bacterium]
MSYKIAINGFGRIGRLVLRAGFASKDIEFVAVNDITDSKTLAHLLKYDSVHGIMNADIKATDNSIIINGKEIKAYSIREPESLPWKDLGVDVVLESTGKFTDRAGAEKHIKAGARKVIISAPAKGPDVTFVLGVNEEVYDKSKHHVISMGSCTTNCLAPIAKILQKEFGIEKGLMTTIHAFTNDQVVLDEPHKDLRRARAAALSMIPTTTGAAKAMSEVIPELKGKLDGLAIRVPTPNVSIVDFVATLSKNTTKDELIAKFKEYAAGPMKGILYCSEEPLVSCDFNGNPHSSIIDIPNITVIGGNMVKILSWYDNEWGFSNRMVELLSFIMR